MQQDNVRIEPLDPARFTPEQQALVGSWSVLNISRVLARHPDLYGVYVPFIEKVIRRTELPPWDREVVVIRLLAQCGERYEFAHHVDIARKAGMSEAQVEAIRRGGEELSDFDRSLIRAADELLHERCISDATWEALAQRYSTVQLMELVGLAGCYVTIAMMTRSFGIPLETATDAAEQLSAIRDYT